MPPQLQALLQDKRMLIGIVAAIVLILGGVFFMNMQGGGGSKKNDPCAIQIKTPEQSKLVTIKGNVGKAMEIQALLSRHNIHLKQTGEGEEVILEFPPETTLCERDTAFLALVQSGLMDKNVGLEAFDKGDLTASREEKRIKLIRSQQGELARLLRKMDPVEDASVTISIPEQTLFRSEEKPISASVQVTLPVDTMLTKSQVRAITNLIVGSIQGLDAKHLAIADTNGNTYSSVLDAGSEMTTELEEQDNYMKQKVAAQLDHLVGAGNYVVTVSTELRQALKETMVQEYDPQGGVVNSKQTFNENLNTNGHGPAVGGAASNFLPNSMATTVTGTGSANKDYLRNGVEVTYNNSKTQWVETRPVGMVEDISVAVTIDADHFPDMSVNELQTLLANAASPKVRPERVSIARSEGRGSGSDILPHSEAPEAKPDMTWLYWAGGAILFCVLMILLLSLTKKGGKDISEDFEQTQSELTQLRDIAMQQQAQIQATQQQTQMLLEAQQRQMQQVQQLESSAAETHRQIAQNGGDLEKTLEELREVVASPEMEEDDLSLQIKSWIESS